MKITFNGQLIEVDSGTTLLSFVTQHGIELEGCAASVDERIVPKSTWSEFVLEEGMNLDVFTLVAGG